MNVLAIDPGPKESSFILWDCGIITEHATKNNETVLDYCRAAHDVYRAQVVIEWIVGYGLTVGSETFETCRWVGRFEQAAGGAHLVTRKKVKRHLCETDQARDSHIRQALIAKLGVPGTKKKPGATFGLAGGEWSALAVAVTWAERQP